MKTCSLATLRELSLVNVMGQATSSDQTRYLTFPSHLDVRNVACDSASPNLKGSLGYTKDVSDILIIYHGDVVFILCLCLYGCLRSVGS